MLVLLLSSLWCGGYYFSNATIYDPSLHSLREGAHILVDEKGRVAMVTLQAPTVPQSYKVVKDALVLPHYSDFYSLIQERGLGFDDNISADSQGRIARCLRAFGIHCLRDPVFPPSGLNDDFQPALQILAQNGYLEMPGGPAAEFALLVKPETKVSALGLSETGPITLWWTDVGTGKALEWPKNPELVNRLISHAHEKNQKIGCYIQDARPADMKALYAFDFDFYEGIPADGSRVADFPDKVIWVPLAALNDKRYCARELNRNLAMVGHLGLYGALDLSSVEANLDSIRGRLSERCGIWKKRRPAVYASLREWIESDGRFAIGSAGGHLCLQRRYPHRIGGPGRDRRHPETALTGRFRDHTSTVGRSQRLPQAGPSG